MLGEKAYFMLGEIARRWGCNTTRIVQNRIEGRLRIATQIDPTLIDFERVGHVGRGWKVDASDHSGLVMEVLSG